jgi:hypothetical protein
MSTFQTTAQAGPFTRLRLPRRLVMLTLVVALAAAAVTVALVASGGTSSAAPRGAHAAIERQYLGGPGEGRGVRIESPAANDGSQHPGARP